MDNMWGKDADLANPVVRQSRYNEARRTIRQTLRRLSRKSRAVRPTLVTAPPVTHGTRTISCKGVDKL